MANAIVIDFNLNNFISTGRVAPALILDKLSIGSTTGGDFLVGIYKTYTSVQINIPPKQYFENLDFDITAERAPHFGFGGGMHHCIGHYVARLDMKEAFKALSRRLPNMKILPGATYLPDSGNTGPTKLPI